MKNIKFNSKTNGELQNSLVKFFYADRRPGL